MTSRGSVGCREDTTGNAGLQSAAAGSRACPWRPSTAGPGHGWCPDSTNAAISSTCVPFDIDGRRPEQAKPAVPADEAQVTRQIDRVGSVRGAMNKTRTLMLLHIRQVLTTEQRAKLNAVYARWEQERRGRDKERSAPDGNRRPDESGRRPN